MGTPELRGINREQGFEAKPDISPTIRAILRTRTHPLDLPRTEGRKQILCHLGMEMEKKFLAFSMIEKMEFYGLENRNIILLSEMEKVFLCRKRKTKQDFPAK
jgi:hypothetical protein